MLLQLLLCLDLALSAAIDVEMAGRVQVVKLSITCVSLFPSL